MGAVFPEILGVSQRNNSARDITGCLLAWNGWFMQALEGAGGAVLTTYDAIERDDRHHQLKLVCFEPVPQRIFPQWSMCGRVLSPADQEIVDVLEQRGDFDPRRMKLASAMQLLQRVQELQSKHRDDPVLLD
jgi:hypothetical protein